MSPWIKICGNTSLEDARLAADAGADAVGFVFAPSPRRVTVEQAAEITPHLPAQLEKIGVFVDASMQYITAAVEGAQLTGVQLHFAAPRELPQKIRARFGSRLRILRVVHFDGSGAIAAFGPEAVSSVDGILIDSRTSAAVGGTGVKFDWGAARETFLQQSDTCRLIAAGGLSPENVAEAITTLRPWGVDVVSGVEAEPGRKDAEKVRAFVANARAASGDSAGV
jgi:phosphoribosylanthranilate isomerase